MRIFKYIYLTFIFCFCSCASWNSWHDAESVKAQLASAQKKHKVYFSQFNLYDPRIYPNQTKFTEVTNESPYIYGIDFFDASGTYWGEEYKTRNRKNIVTIVKQQWKDNKAIPSFSWHLENPYSPDSNDDNWYMASRYCMNANSPKYPKEHKYVVHEILTNTGSSCGTGRFLKALKEHEKKQKPKPYKTPRAWFEDRCIEIASIINELVDEEGRPIPMLFRPWHECEDDWQWWGSSYVSENDYIEFFRFTEKLIYKYAPHAEIIWVYGPDSYWHDERQFMSRYPGDEYIDVIGYDDYQLADPKQLNTQIQKARIVTRLANEHNKIAALMETHNNNAPNSEEFYKVSLMPLLTDKEVNFSIVQIWDSHKFSTKGEFQDRQWLLEQKMIIKKR